MELVYRDDFATREQAAAEISEFFEASCNRQRAQGTMNFLSPVDSELLNNYP